jgi:hypothetical protein
MAYIVAMHSKCFMTVWAYVRLFLSVAPEVKEKPARAVKHIIALITICFIVTAEECLFLFVSDTWLVWLTDEIHSVVETS